MATNIIDGGGAQGDPSGVATATWTGPFNPGELHDAYDAYFTDVNFAQPIPTTQTVTARLEQSDPGWWNTTPFANVIDGGNSSSTYSNVIDGGNSGALP